MSEVDTPLLTINAKRENPVLTYEAFPELTRSTSINQEVFNQEDFDLSRRDFIMKNCPPQAISCHEEGGSGFQPLEDNLEDNLGYNKGTMLVDEEKCIHCRQCEIASNGAFQVQQAWEGRVELRREKCPEGCFACADICPTRALHIDEGGELVLGKEWGQISNLSPFLGELVLADYYCIKCGACLQVCPIHPVYEERESQLEWAGVSRTIIQKRITNADTLPLLVERWRVHHTPVKSAAWIEALTKMADDKAGMVEIDRKRALKRRDLLKALPGYKREQGGSSDQLTVLNK